MLRMQIGNLRYYFLGEIYSSALVFTQLKSHHTTLCTRMEAFPWTYTRGLTSHLTGVINTD